ncbi:hypothetical protein DRQ11_13045, partial [candidate division KSB1 bacterium]
EGCVKVDVPVEELSTQALTNAGFPLPLSTKIAMQVGLVEQPIGYHRLVEAIRNNNGKIC